MKLKRGVRENQQDETAYNLVSAIERYVQSVHGKLYKNQRRVVSMYSTHNRQHCVGDATQRHARIHPQAPRIRGITDII